MKPVLKDDFIDGYINRGRAEMLLDLLEMRFSVPNDIRKRIERCNDTNQIKTWHKRVLAATSLEDVFA